MSILHYVTYKYIVIKDKKLGLAYYLLAAIILIYTVVQIFINKAFMQYDLSPSGNIRLLVNTPLHRNHDNSSNYVPSYCCELEKTNCTKCKRLDGLSLNWPVESRAVNIATFIKKRVEKLENSHYKVYRENDYFSLDPEDALIKVEHSVMSKSTKISASHRMMYGKISDVDGNTIKINGISYTYHVRHLPYSDYRVKQEIPMPDEEGYIHQRVVFKRYTTRVEFIQTGKIGKFSLSNLLIQLASLMGLLTLTATIIDTVALYLIPSKEKYRQYVFDSSPEIRINSETKEKSQ